MKLKGLRLKDVLLYSLPSMASSIIEPFAGVVDTALVGRFNTGSLAALGLSVSILSTFTWLFNFIVQASTQAVANGQVLKDPKLLKQRIKITFITALFIGCAAALFLGAMKPILFSFLGGYGSEQTQLWQKFSAYYDLRVLFHPITVLALASLSLVRGLSALTYVLKLTFMATTLNIVVSYILLHFYDQGLNGVALGTICSYVFLFLGSLLFLIKDSRIGVGFWKVQTKTSGWLVFGSHSFSLFTRSLFLSGSFFLMTKVAGHMGIKSLAAHQIMLQLWLMIAFLLDGLALTGSLLGGKFFFTGYKKRTFLAFRSLTFLGLMFGIFCTFLFWLGEKSLVGLFTRDPEVAGILKILWPILLMFTVVNSIAFIGDGFLFGLEAFSFVGKNMALGCLLFFIPMVALSLIKNELFYVWLGMGLLSLYRSLTSFRYLKTFFIGVI